MMYHSMSWQKHDKQMDVVQNVHGTIYKSIFITTEFDLKKEIAHKPIFH